MCAHISGIVRLQNPIWTTCPRRETRLIRYPSNITSPHCRQDVLTLNILVPAAEAFPAGSWVSVRGELLGGTRQSFLDVEVFEGGLEATNVTNGDFDPVITLSGRFKQKNYGVYDKCIEIDVNTSGGTLGFA